MHTNCIHSYILLALGTPIYMVFCLTSVNREVHESTVLKLPMHLVQYVITSKQGNWVTSEMAAALDDTDFCLKIGTALR